MAIFSPWMGCFTLKFRCRVVILYFDGLLGVVCWEQALGYIWDRVTIYGLVSPRMRGLSSLTMSCLRDKGPCALGTSTTMVVVSWRDTKHHWSWNLFINVFSAPIKGRAQCYASLHSNFHEHLWSHDAGKVLCWIFTWFGMICLFSKCNKSSTIRLRSWYTTFYLRCKCVTFLCAMQWSVALRSAFIRGRENIYE